MRVALGGADRHAGSGRDLLEREAESVLQHENAGLGGGEPCQAGAKVRPELRELGLEIGCGAGGDPHVFLERIVSPAAAALHNVTAGIDREPVQPRRESGLAAELAELRAQLRKGVLGSVAGVLGVVEQMRGETADPGSVPLAQRLEGTGIAVLGAPDENRVAESIMSKLWLGPQHGADPAARAQRRLHPASLVDRLSQLAGSRGARGTPASLCDRIHSVVGRPQSRGFLVAAAAGAATLAIAAPASAAGPRVLVATLADDINPVSQDYLEDQVRRAEKGGYGALVVVLDTPGGLGTSMRGIVKSFLASPVPIVVYVSPAGSSADSAGAVIGQAADVLAMAPQTNIGSSTPITAGGQDFSKDLRRKVVNDAAAYIAELAREHGRNAEAAEAMVRDAANFGAREAEARHVADLVAPTLAALLEGLDGRVTQPKGITLRTAGAAVEEVEMSLWQRALDTLIDPNIIALMLSLGVVGLLVELWNPGLVLPGTVGAISLLVGLYGLQVLPVSAAGALLLLLSLGLFVTDALVTAHGALSLAGAVTFVIGALMLFDPAGPAYQVSLWTAVAIAATLVLLLGVALSRVARARRNPVEVGVDRLVGAQAEVRRDGLVAVNGELWRAHRADGRALPRGERVTIEEVEDGLVLVVGPGNQTEGT